MADRPYSGFGGTSERTSKRMRCRYNTFSRNNDHAVYPQDGWVIHAKIQHRTQAKDTILPEVSPQYTEET